MTKIKVYACYAVKIYKNKPVIFFQNGGGGAARRSWIRLWNDFSILKHIVQSVDHYFSLLSVCDNERSISLHKHPEVLLSMNIFFKVCLKVLLMYTLQPLSKNCSTFEIYIAFACIPPLILIFLVTKSLLNF